MNYGIVPLGKPNDARGENYKVEHDKSLEVSVQRTKAGKARGAHYHQKEEEFFVVSGRVLFLSRDTQNRLKEPRIYSRGETIKTIPLEPHMVLALEETILIGIKPDPFEAEPDPPFQAIADAINGLNPTEVNSEKNPPSS